MSAASQDMLHIPEAELHSLALLVLQHLGLSQRHAAAIARIVVAGQADRIATIEIQQADGDRSLMTLRPA